jgi:branched-chain amino acid transport system substrate-binding protein
MIRRNCLATVCLAATIAFAASARADDISIGAHMPLTGSLARSGQAFNEGMQVALKVFNESQGKHRIKVTVIDDESQPAKTSWSSAATRTSSGSTTMPATSAASRV